LSPCRSSSPPPRRNVRLGSTSPLSGMSFSTSLRRRRRRPPPLCGQYRPLRAALTRTRHPTPTSIVSTDSTSRHPEPLNSRLVQPQPSPSKTLTPNLARSRAWIELHTGATEPIGHDRSPQRDGVSTHIVTPHASHHMGVPRRVPTDCGSAVAGKPCWRGVIAPAVRQPVDEVRGQWHLLGAV
jgi:hypothetical protein